MAQAPKKDKLKKKPEEYTTEEVFKKVFPKKVINELKKVTGKTPEKKEK